MDKIDIVKEIEFSSESRCVITRQRIDDDDGYLHVIVSYRYEECGETDCEICFVCTSDEAGESYLATVYYPDGSKELNKIGASEEEVVSVFNAHLLHKDKVPLLRVGMVVG